MADVEEEALEPEELETPEGDEPEEVEETNEDKIARLEKEKKDAEDRATDLDSKNKQLFERNKKLAGKPAEVNLSAQDVLVLTKANVHEDDLETVMEYASFKKLSLSDALKDSTLKSILDGNEDVRKTANATQVRGGARGTAEITGEAILQKAEQTGEVPETTEGMNKLFLARQERRLNNRPKRRT